MIMRTWACLNARCAVEFTSGAAKPKCPTCGYANLRWVPKGFAVRNGDTNKIDNIVRGLADDFGMTNIPRVYEGEAVKKTNRGSARAPTAKLGGMDVPIDRVTSYNTKAKVAGGQGTHFDGAMNVLRQHTSVEHKADK